MNASSDDHREPTVPDRLAVDPAAVVAADHRPEFAWTVARTVLVVVFCASGLVALLEVWQAETSVAPTVVAAVMMAALLAIQLFHFSRPGARLKSPRGYALLALLAALAYVPLVEYGWTWISLPPFLAGCLLLVLPGAAAWTSFTMVMASLLVIRIGLHESALTVVYGVADAFVFGLSVYLLTKLAIVVAELHTARDELADLAVAEQRLRFARDLHDVLGLSLSDITLKGELTLRLIAKHPQRAKDELAAILDIARRALADVRSVASGYRELSLDQEVRSAEAVLAASDVRVRLDVAHTDLPGHVGNILGKVLREGVTNVLRHSDATHCDIVVRQSGGVVSLDILNNGVIDRPADDQEVDTGIRDLAGRLAALGGELVTPASRDGWFLLRATVPLRGRPAGDRQSHVPGVRWSVRDPSPLGTGTSKVLVNSVFCGIYVAASTHQLMMTTTPRNLVLGVGCLTVLLAVQLVFFSRVTTKARTVTSYVLLLVQACAIYVPLVVQRADWVSVPGWLAGDALLSLPALAGWLVFGANVGVVIWANAVSTGQALDIMFQAAATIITGLIAYGLTSLTRLITELHAARRQLATKAVAEERLRFARDLHDLLGLSLSAITLKCELVNRLVMAYPARAADELTDILSLVRQALTDVRSVADGYRELSLDKETRSAEAVLTAAEVAVHMELDYDGLPPRVRTELAVVLREGVTNVLRHSTATRCEILLRQDDERVSLAIVNDGAGDRRDAAGGTPSSGIRNLSERIGRLGGELAHGPDPDGRYRLLATLPI